MSQLLTCYAEFCAGLLDDFDMTFQVLLIGDDGIVLASDRLFRTRGLREMMEAKRPSYQPTLGTKIYISDDNLTICSFAGGPYSEKIARRIVTTCCPSGLSEPHWINAIEAAAKGITEYSEQLSDELLVIRADNVTALKLIRQQSDDPTPTPIDSCMYAGLETDAILIPKLFWRSNIKCERLRTLAIVSITQASIEAPHLIGGGVDVVVVSADRRVEQSQYNQAEADVIREAFMTRIWEGLLPQ